MAGAFCVQNLIAQSPLKLSAWLLLVCLAVLAPRASANWACKPQGPSMDEILYRSPIVMMGKVIEHYKDPSNPAVFKAELEVYCIYKGGRLPVKINITNAGIVPGVCFRTNFTVGSSVLAYIQQHEDGRLTPVYKEHPAGYKDEIFVNCGISIEYPLTVTPADAPYNCDEDADYMYDETKCLSYTPPETEVVEEIEVNPPQDGQTLPDGQKEKPQPGGPSYTEEKNTQGANPGAAQEDDNGSATSLRMSLPLFLSLSAAVVLFMS